MHISMIVSKIMSKLNDEGVCGVARAVFNRLFKRDRTVPMQQCVFTPKIDAEKNLNIRKLGTHYGGWSFVEDEKLYEGTIISCGLGEDASFDVEFASKYNAKIIIVDPTVRAIKHFEGIMQRIGLDREISHIEGGNQPINSYDLSKLDNHSLQLVPKALWTHNDTVEFFAPPNPGSVSHSIVDIHNNYSKKGRSYKVGCITIDRLLETFGLDSQPVLLKMDIEGAATDVIRDMIDKGIYPYQILVEFEELGSSSLPGMRNFEEIDRFLRDKNYKLSIFEPPCNFSYTRK